MSEDWKYQLRVVLDDAAAAAARDGRDTDDLKPLLDILDRHGATLKCQYDAFAGYVAEAERNGTENYHLYQWTRDTIENPLKQAKYKTNFTLYVDGAEVYDKAKADPLEAELQPLVGTGAVLSMARHDTNPANNPQMPAKYRRKQAASRG